VEWARACENPIVEPGLERDHQWLLQQGDAARERHWDHTNLANSSIHNANVAEFSQVYQSWMLQQETISLRTPPLEG